MREKLAEAGRGANVKLLTAQVRPSILASLTKTEAPVEVPKARPPITINSCVRWDGGAFAQSSKQGNVVQAKEFEQSLDVCFKQKKWYI